ncbi:MAG: sodium:proton antiporter [Fimbriimonadaceae bacterium]|nr:sodium:proton antiporter [Fimbriimonadaceae bacterium]
MESGVMQGLVLVLLLGVGAQWIAWRTRLPGILLLLLAGIVAGPVTGILKPDETFGRDVVLSVASLAVSIILFEGALSLKFRELKATGAVVPLLVTVGLAAGWAVGASAAVLIAGFELRLALLWGALMTVSGPTVILPLLRQVRPVARLRSILKWESIVADPIGAILAVIVFEIAYLQPDLPTNQAALMIVKLLATGTGIGLGGAALIVIALRRFWVPDHLHVPLTLGLVVGVYSISNMAFHESGLLAVTAMGLVMANQSLVKVEHILEFKENLRVLLISTLFILLSARLEPTVARLITPTSIVVILVLIVVARPVTVFVSTAFSSLKWHERLFLAGVMPRGIVAAAVSTVFALRLTETRLSGGEELATYSILTIVITVFIYGLGAAPLARYLKVADEDPQGVVIAGADDVGIRLGLALQKLGQRVLLLDIDPAKVAQAEKAGLQAAECSAFDDHSTSDLDLRGIGRFIGATPSDEVNDLAVVHWTPHFGRANVFRLNPNRKADDPHNNHGRVLGSPALKHGQVLEALHNGGSIEAINAEDLNSHEGAIVLASGNMKRYSLHSKGTKTATDLETIVAIIPSVPDQNRSEIMSS